MPNFSLFSILALAASLHLCAERAEADNSSANPILHGEQACELGQALLAEGHDNSSRAQLFLERCHRTSSSADLRQAISALRTKLRTQGYAPVALVLSPDTAFAVIQDGFSDDRLGNDDELWLPIGEYRIEVHADGYEDAVFSIEVTSSVRMMASLELTEKKIETVTVIDIGKEPGSELGEVTHSADMRDKDFGSLLAERYRRAPDPNPPDESQRIQKGSLWPVFLAAASIGTLVSGVVLQIKDRQASALLGYGMSGVLGGGALYLHLRSSPNPAPTRASYYTENPVMGVRYYRTW